MSEKTINIVISDLCEDIDRLTAERDQWKAKYEECSKKFSDFVDSSIKNGEETSKNWIVYLTTNHPKRYIVAWKNVTTAACGVNKKEVFLSWNKCQKRCEELDAQIPGVRHWPIGV